MPYNAAKSQQIPDSSQDAHDQMFKAAHERAHEKRSMSHDPESEVHENNLVRLNANGLRHGLTI